MAKLLLSFTLVFSLLFSATHSRLDFQANEAKRDVINRLTVVSKGGLPDFPANNRLPNNILLPTDAKLHESDDGIRLDFDAETATATDKNRLTEDVGTVASEFEDKEPDFSVGDHEKLREDPIMATIIEDKEPEAEEKAQQEFRSTRPLTTRPMPRFRPINRRFDQNGMRALPWFKFPSRCRHHHIRRQIPVQQQFGPRFRPQRELEQDQDNMVMFKKGGFLSWREIPARRVDQPAFFREMTTEFPGSGDQREEGPMNREFDRPRWIFHHRHHRHHHHFHHHDDDGDRDEVEEREARRGGRHEDREDDGVLMKIRKFLTHF